MSKTASYYIEFYGSYFLALLAGIISYKLILPDAILTKIEVFDKTIDFAGITFGFLLTVITLLIQTPLKVVQSIKVNKQFERLVNANKRAVISALFLVAFSLTILIIRKNETMFLDCSDLYKRLLNGLYIFLVILTLLQSYFFVKIFYLIILTE